MQTFDKINENKNLSLALGFFDGVHLAHQKVIKSAVDYAKQHDLKSAVITFKDHPCCYFYDVKPSYILTREERRNKIAELGVDFLYEIDFDTKLSKLSPTEYLEDILIKNFHPKSISTGFNHYFGADKKGDVKFLDENQKKYGYKYFEISEQTINNNVISSTAIRTYLQDGKIDLANEMLGYRFKLSGKIVEGQKIGRTLGYRTANVFYPDEIIKIPYGVYSVETQYGKGITNFGIRPTISKEKTAVLETHILNFDDNIYGKTLDIEFTSMIRPEKKFNSIQELKTQIAKDIQAI